MGGAVSDLCFSDRKCRTDVIGGGGRDLRDLRESVDFRVDFAVVGFGLTWVFAAAVAAGVWTWAFGVEAWAGDSDLGAAWD